ncbi:dihydroxy-acid dehydratase [Loktanella sp. SALINAS62]|uniref:dihydroxy-acid dehydratase n=1 Tax=Loktanella sp. SALINAS62 TaxID=2706124 RepID=UPI001B8C0FCF|nr:dihydroxy-acid dehydratase [Loktanella sp. SALINAS62]MBS1302112.1 dihydroxy-acid dehydratase [Loktanella sp. SALINAS62]
MWSRLLFGAMALLLSACEVTGPIGGPGAQATRLAGGIVVAAPDGYCLDPQVSRPARGFAFLVACGLLDPGVQTPFPDTLAMITVQAGDAGSAIVAGSEPAFRAFLETDQGATLLGVSDIGGPIEVVTTNASDNAVSVYTLDTAPPDIIGTQPESWRLFTDVRGRVVTVTVRGMIDAPLSQFQSRDLLDRVGELLRLSNTREQSAA